MSFQRPVSSYCNRKMGFYKLWLIEGTYKNEPR
jgi:hypothetical protein